MAFRYISTGGLLPKSFIVQSGALPTGVILQSDGQVVGTYAAVGTFNWVVKVTDAVQNTITLADSCVINPGPILATGVNAADQPIVNYSSNNVTTWNSISRATLDNGGVPLWNGSRWVIVSGSRSDYSTDLTSWTSGGIPGGLVVRAATDTATGRIVGIGGNGGTSTVRYSTDGAVSWQTGTLSQQFDTIPRDIAFGNGIYVISTNAFAGQARHIRLSTDGGVNFNNAPVAPPAALWVRCSKWDPATARWYLCGGQGAENLAPGYVYTTTDFASYTLVHTTAGASFAAVAKGLGSNWVGVTFGGQIFYTTDNWATSNLSATTVEGTSGNRQVGFDGEKFIVADNNGSNLALTRTSLDGNIWSASTAMVLAGTVALASKWVTV